MPKRKTKKQKKMSKKDYEKLRKALKNYNANQQDDTSSNIGYGIGILIFFIFLFLKLINAAS